MFIERTPKKSRRAPSGAARTAVLNNAAPTELRFELYVRVYKHNAPTGAKSRTPCQRLDRQGGTSLRKPARQ